MKPVSRQLILLTLAPVGWAGILDVQATLTFGGGNSSGGTYALAATLAPAAPGLASGGSYAVHDSVLSTPTVVQTDGVPTLRIVQTGVSLTIAWPSPSSGFQLEETDSLTTPAWANTPSPPTLVENEQQFTQPIPAGAKYYRLRKP